MRLYAFLGQSLAQRDVAGDNPYREWIETYATPDFEKLAAGLEETLNRYVTRPRRKPRAPRTAGPCPWNWHSSKPQALSGAGWRWAEKRVMSVATSDSGAGIQEDLKAFLRCGVYGTTAIVATTAQNTVGVTGIHAFPPQVAVEQIEAIASDIEADAVKTGMLCNVGIISATAETIEHLGLPNVVVDPVMVAESGATLLEPEAVETYKQELFPLATAITPNLNEAFALLNEEVDEDHIEDCAVTLHALGRRP